MLSSLVSNLEVRPRRKEGNLWADYVELLCLASQDLEFSKADLISRILGASGIADADDENGTFIGPDEEQDSLGGDFDVQMENDFAVPTPEPVMPPESVSELFEITALEDEGISESGWSGNDVASTASAVADRRTLRADDTFSNLLWRSANYGDAYPFKISANNDVLSCNSALSDQQRLYCFLLLCSNLNYAKKHMQLLTKNFEVLCIDYLKTLLSPDAVVHPFGAGVAGGVFSGKLFNKIDKLAALLNEKLLVEEGDFDDADVGDGGLDIVAWLEPEDACPTRVMIFCQCACTRQWISKQSSSHEHVWSQRIAFTLRPLNAIFIPQSFRGLDGKWFQRLKIHDSLLVDRLRLVKRIGPALSNPIRTWMSTLIV